MSGQRGCIWPVIAIVCVIIAGSLLFGEMLMGLGKWYKRNPGQVIFVILAVGGIAYAVYKVKDEK